MFRYGWTHVLEDRNDEYAKTQARALHEAKSKGPGKLLGAVDQGHQIDGVGRPRSDSTVTGERSRPGSAMRRQQISQAGCHRGRHVAQNWDRADRSAGKWSGEWRQSGARTKHRRRKRGRTKTAPQSGCGLAGSQRYFGRVGRRCARHYRQDLALTQQEFLLNRTRQNEQTARSRLSRLSRQQRTLSGGCALEYFANRRCISAAHRLPQASDRYTPARALPRSSVEALSRSTKCVR